MCRLGEAPRNTHVVLDVRGKRAVMRRVVGRSSCHAFSMATVTSLYGAQEDAGGDFVHEVHSSLVVPADVAADHVKVLGILW